MPWHEAHTSLPRHPKTKRARRLLGVSTPTMVGTLHMLWGWCMTYAPDGDLSRFDDEDIADAVEWTGDAGALVRVLVACGFINDDRTVHDWSDYGGKLHASRQQDAERKRKERRKADEMSANLACPPDVHRTSTGHPRDIRVTAHVEDIRGQDKTGEDNDSPQQPLVVVPPKGRNEQDEPEQSTKTKPAPKPPKPKPTRLPDDFHITDDLWTFAESKGWPREWVNEQTEQFVDYWRALPGVRGTKLDWPATWRGWLRRSAEQQLAAPLPHVNGRKPSRQASAEATRAMLLSQARGMDQ
jgi:hypothetical protein